MSIDPPLQRYVDAICDQAIREGRGTFAIRQDLLQLYEVFADKVAEKPQKWLVWARLGGYAAVGQDLAMQLLQHFKPRLEEFHRDTERNWLRSVRPPWKLAIREPKERWIFFHLIERRLDEACYVVAGLEIPRSEDTDESGLSDFELLAGKLMSELRPLRQRNRGRLPKEALAKVLRQLDEAGMKPLTHLEKTERQRLADHNTKYPRMAIHTFSRAGEPNLSSEARS